MTTHLSLAVVTAMFSAAISCFRAPGCTPLLFPCYLPVPALLFWPGFRGFARFFNDFLDVPRPHLQGFTGLTRRGWPLANARGSYPMARVVGFVTSQENVEVAEGEDDPAMSPGGMWASRSATRPTPAMMREPKARKMRQRA
jgi:hypothetical protein